jgi:uncharacterized membrane protein
MNILQKSKISPKEAKGKKRFPIPWINEENRYLFLKIGAIVVGALVLLFGLVPAMPGASKSFGATLVLVLAIILIYAAIARHVDPKVKRRAADENPYHRVFFKGTVVLTILLTFLGILGAILVYLEFGNIFQAMGLATSVIWISIFLIYFMWSVYHYNINYGITDEDWKKIANAKERYAEGELVDERDMNAPIYNPYRSQTFGLPPGTVRGMIAFTLLLGGMSLLITSFGSNYSGAELALIRQQFEFFETAFLMMIAFYFGDRSLRYLRSRGPSPKSAPSAESGPPPVSSLGSSPLTKEKKPSFDQVSLDDLDLQEEDETFTQLEMPAEPELDDKRKQISMVSLGSKVGLAPASDLPQIMDNSHERILSDMDIRIALEELEEKENIRLSLPVVKAVIKVETGDGRGHLKDGRAKILFEGHKFWYWLKQGNINPDDHLRGNEDILFEKWTREHYKGGILEYKRLERAKTISPKAAIYSTSWGLFQILGENLEHHLKSRKYKDAAHFEECQHQSERIHFLDFLAFIKSKKVRGLPLIDYISENRKGDYDWEAFAFGYNGSGYKVMRYHERMKEAYEQFKYSN